MVGMSAVLFFDPVCAHPYDTGTLRLQAMGGTEATVVRVADALEALVVQHNRTHASGRYQPPRRDPTIAQVIVNRDTRALRTVREALSQRPHPPLAARPGAAALEARQEDCRGC